MGAKIKRSLRKRNSKHQQQSEICREIALRVKERENTVHDCQSGHPEIMLPSLISCRKRGIQLLRQNATGLSHKRGELTVLSKSRPMIEIPGRICWRQV